MRLKIIVLFFIILSLTSFRKDDQSLIGINKEVTIEGELSNFGNKQLQVVIEYQDLVTSELITYISPINDGTFQFRFPKYNIQDIKLIFGNDHIRLLVIPGEHIHVKINIKDLINGVIFRGDRAKFHNDFTALDYELNKLKTLIDSTESKINILAPNDYKASVIDNENRLLKFLKDYSRKNVVDPLILDWFEANTKYEAANHLIYPYNVKFEKYNVKPNYWNFFDKYPVKNEHALFCSEYYQYCTHYYIYLGNVEARFGDGNKYYGSDWKQFYQINIDTIHQTVQGIAADILISNLSNRFINDDLKSFNELMNQIFVKIENENIRNILSARIKSVNTNMENIGSSQKIKIYDYRKDTLKSDILDVLRFKYRNKVIYVDLWASWCGPCIAEMPHSCELQKEFTNRDIVFVFLCNHDNFMNDRAKTIISEKQVTGEHYLMNFHQSYLNQDRFKSKGIPAYMIINRKGEIVDNDAPRPSSPEIRQRLNEILK